MDRYLLANSLSREEYVSEQTGNNVRRIFCSLTRDTGINFSRFIRILYTRRTQMIYCLGINSYRDNDSQKILSR